MTQDKQLYESDRVWDQEMQLGQRNLLQALVDFMPEDTETVLDVGCGDGKITRQLIIATGIPIVGLDSSAEGLARCMFETIHGDATALGIKDRAFDVVITTDMLEHLPDDIEGKAWSELFRVAAKTVLIAVPFREELLDGMARCEKCGTQYHVNWHMRSYDWPELIRRAPEGWKATCIVLTGEPWSPYHPLETLLRREVLDEWSGWSEGICPRCGAHGQASAPPSSLPPTTAAALGMLIYEDVLSRGTARMHSEVLVVYRRDDCDEWLPGKELSYASSVRQEAGVVHTSTARLEASLLPYPLTGRAVAAVDGTTVVQLPAYQGSDSLRIKWNTGADTSVKLTIEDGLGLLFSSEVSPQDGGDTIINLPRAIIPGYYGVLVRMPMTEVVASLALNPGPVGFMVSPVDSTSVGYHSSQFGFVPAFIQATRPVWLDETILASPIVRQHHHDWRRLFDFIEQVSRAERDSLRAERDSLVARPEVRLSTTIRSKLKSLIRANR